MKRDTGHLLIVGDSIALGVTDMVSDEVRGVAADSFVDQLRRRMVGWRVDVDAAVYRTTNAAALLLPDLLRRYRPDVVLFVLGGNDLDINWKRFIISSGRRIRPNTPLEAFDGNLRRLAETARASGVIALFSDLPAPDIFERGRRMSAVTGEDFVAVLERIEGGAIAERQHGLFSETIDRVARETGTPVARWAQRLADLPAAQRFGPDAVHPSESAHAVIADVVTEALTAQLRFFPGATS